MNPNFPMTHRIMWIAYTIAPAIYAGLVLSGVARNTAVEPPRTMLFVFMAVAALLIVVSRVLRDQFARDPERVFVLWVMDEAIAIFGLVLSFMGGPVAWCLPFMVVGLVMVFVDAPGRLPGAEGGGLISIAALAGGLAAAGITTAGLLATAPAPAFAAVTTFTPGGFTVEQKLTLPGTPERIYDAITGDLLPWWDHTFSKKPHAFFIEPWPGGGFYELFDEKGNGVKHATVLWAERGKRLRFEGPLGLSGNATIFVCTYDLAAKGDSTTVTLTAAGAGKVEEGWAAGVDGVWHHFLYDGLKTYVEGGKDQGRKPWTAQRSAALFKKNE